jgi:serine phosphatase RsbU (regulator of sigma subunit)
MGTSYSLVLSVFYLASGVFIFLLGLTILRTGRSSAPSRATALILFFTGLGPILSATSIILQSTLRQDAVVFRSMVESFEYLWEFYFPSLLLFSLVYPREYRVPSFPVLTLLVFAPHVFHLVTIMVGDMFPKSIVDLLGGEVSLGERTISLAGLGKIVAVFLSTLVKLHKQLFLIVNILYASLALFFLWRSMRRHINPRIIGQLRTVIAGVTVSIVAYALAKIVPVVPSVSATPRASLALVNFSLVAGGGSVAYAVIKQQFLGIKHVVRRSILYGAAAVFFALIYLVVVKPVSDFFGQYSVVSKDAFETGFIILAIIAFQPILFRTEELLEQVLLRGKDDPRSKFRELGSAISTAGNVEELERRLVTGFGDILDASTVRLHLNPREPRFERTVQVLERIGEPIVRVDILKLGEFGQLSNDEVRSERARRGFRRRRSKRGLIAAMSLIGDDEVLVPVMKDRRCVGYLAFGEKSYGTRYSSEELAMLSVFSNQLGVALDNIRLLRENVEKKVIEEELLIARRIQTQLLPSESPRIPGYDLSASTIPSRQVGGDYYDFAVLDDGSLALVVADVSGKGIPASLLMATLRAAVNSNADARKRPAAMLERINTLLYQSTSPEEFATVFYGVVDLDSGEMRYANAGHEFPFLITHEGITRLGESGIVLGCMLDFTYEENACSIPKGGSLVLYTDGLTDAETGGGESFGEDRLRQTLTTNGEQSSASLCSAILDEVRGFSVDGDYHDDLTLVVLKRA